MSKTAIALGTFDGIHKGHTAVLNAALAAENSVAIAFKYPPKAYINKSACSIMGASEKQAALYSMGFSRVHFLDFEQIRELPAESFLEYIKREFSPDFISCGFNYHFGFGGKGDTKLLKCFCDKNKINLKICEPITQNGEVVSSSLIRDMLLKGKTEQANALCYMPFGFSAEIVNGDKRGRTIGYPTVNQLYPKDLLPIKFGVYETKITVGGKGYRGITNIGIRPTYKTEYISAETYILDFCGDIYGEIADIRFLKFIRPEQKFSSLEELKGAIEKDINSIK